MVHCNATVAALAPVLPLHKNQKSLRSKVWYLCPEKMVVMYGVPVSFCCSKAVTMTLGGEWGDLVSWRDVLTIAHELKKRSFSTPTTLRAGTRGLAGRSSNCAMSVSGYHGKVQGSMGCLTLMTSGTPLLGDEFGDGAARALRAKIEQIGRLRVHFMMMGTSVIVLGLLRSVP